MDLVITEQDSYTAILRKAWDLQGEDYNLGMLMEEGAEVIQAINKWKRFGDHRAMENLHAEIADLQICIDVLLLNFLSAEEVKNFYRIKMARLAERLT